MSDKVKKLGLVVGRFQPLHNGHKFLIIKAINENDIVAICIGSARKSDPLTLNERRKRLKKYLNELDMGNKEIRIVHVEDTSSDDEWVMELIKESKMTDKTENRFYSADKRLPKAYLDALKKQGISVEKIKRITFNYQTPDKKRHKVSSATQIRKLHKLLNIPL